jgi:hypothetical protein
VAAHTSVAASRDRGVAARSTRVGDNVIPLIPAGGAVPLAFDQTFSTSRDGQDVLHVTLVARRGG